MPLGLGPRTKVEYGRRARTRNGDQSYCRVDDSDKQPMLEETDKSDPALVSVRRRRFLGMGAVVLLILLIILVSFSLGVLVGKFLIVGGEEEAADGGTPDWGSTITGGDSVDWVRALSELITS